MSSYRLAATYVMHEGRAYLVSTINRPSSVIGDYSMYAETWVWPVDQHRERTQEEPLYQDEDCCGSVRVHCAIVSKIAAGQLGFQVRAKEEVR